VSAVDIAASAIGDRIRGRQPSRTSALATSCAAGVGVALFTYKLLRGGAADKGNRGGGNDD
jgi:hypothetical protein